MSIAQTLPLTAIPALLGGAWLDVVSRRVPNWIAGWTVVCGIASRWLSGDLAPSILLASALFCVLFAMWKRGLLGGADVKLLSACAVLVPASAAADFLLAVALAGGGLALVYLAGRHAPVPATRTPEAPVTRGLFPRLCRIELWRMRRAAPLPYVCAIAAGCVFTLMTG